MVLKIQKISVGTSLNPITVYAFENSLSFEVFESFMVFGNLMLLREYQ